MKRFAHYFEILSEFEKFINQRGDDPSDWYCGITADLETRLEEHGVSEASEAFSKEFPNRGCACSAHNSLVNVLGCRGDESWGDDCRFLYIYRMNKNTVPC